jgi:hypothetical protein
MKQSGSTVLVPLTRKPACELLKADITPMDSRTAGLDGLPPLLGPNVSLVNNLHLYAMANWLVPKFNSFEVNHLAL